MCYYVANLHKIIETINLQMKKRYYLCNNVRENKMQVANMEGLLTKRGRVKTPNIKILNSLCVHLWMRNEFFIFL